MGRQSHALRDQQLLREDRQHRPHGAVAPLRGGPYSDVDGVFGPNTAAATVKWQKNHGLGNDADGWVGPNTWNTAHNWVAAADPSEQDSGTFYHFYRGTRVVLLLHQGVTGVWEFKRDVDGSWYTATY
ncbi:peptidoglycan-binding protein [Streptomyces sp. NBC_01718]